MDFWKLLPMGDGNPLFWQDVPLGDGSKTVRFLRIAAALGAARGPGAHHQVFRQRLRGGHASGAGAHELRADLRRQSRSQDQTYSLPDIYAEGATYAIPRWVSPDVVEIAEMGSPGMDSFTISYEAPKKLVLKAGGEADVGKYKLKVASVDQGRKTVKLVLLDETGQGRHGENAGSGRSEGVRSSSPVQPRPAEGDDAVQGHPRRARPSRRFQGGQGDALRDDGCAETGTRQALGRAIRGI